MIPSSYFTQSPRTDQFSQISTTSRSNNNNNNNNHKDKNNFRSVNQSPSPSSSQSHYHQQQRYLQQQQQQQYHQSQSPLTPPPVSLSPINLSVFQSMVEEKRHERISNEITQINKDIDTIKTELINLTNQVNKIQERDDLLLNGLNTIIKKIETIESNQNLQQNKSFCCPSLSHQNTLRNKEYVEISPSTQQTQIQTQIESQSVVSQSQTLVDRINSVMSIHDNNNNNDNHNNDKKEEPISVQEFLYHKQPNAYIYEEEVGDDNNSSHDLLFQESEPPIKRMNLGAWHYSQN